MPYFFWLRCGTNFKFVAYDFLNQLQYDGFVYKPEVLQFIDRYNDAIEVKGTLKMSLYNLYLNAVISRDRGLARELLKIFWLPGDISILFLLHFLMQLSPFNYNIFHRPVAEALSKQLAITETMDQVTSEFGGSTNIVFCFVIRILFVNLFFIAKFMTKKCLVLLKTAKGRGIQDRQGYLLIIMKTLFQIFSFRLSFCYV